MGRCDQAAWVFAGDAPGVWWVVHSQPPRFAARLLSAEEFAAEPRLAAWVPHGINVPVPVHFNLGADVLVITEFLDPIALDESTSPQKAILTEAMIEALHECQQAISRIAAVQASFAPLAEHAEQFLVGWTWRQGEHGERIAEHASGAEVAVSFDSHGDCEATLRHPPPPEHRAGWEADLLRERLERVAGERALCIDAGWDRLNAQDGSEMQEDVFTVLAIQDRRRLSWAPCERQLPGHEQPVWFAGLRVSGPVALTFPTAVEIDASSPLQLGNRPLSETDVDNILRLRHGYGLSHAVDLVAAQHFGWFEEPVEDLGERRRTSPLPYYPMEVEVIQGGNLYAAVVFQPADGRGLFKLAVAPHAPGNGAPSDPGALLPFEGLVCRREQFHVPRYLLDRGS